jgi:hypothetical protein
VLVDYVHSFGIELVDDGGEALLEYDDEALSLTGLAKHLERELEAAE